jgi:hypothetical protein
VVQDDTLVLALTEPPSGQVQAYLLPTGESGTRCFDQSRKNKALKLDLEACIQVDDAILAFGSGSTRARERVVVVEHAPEPLRAWTARIVPAGELYDSLRKEEAFSGSELNIEGSVVIGDRVKWFQRGNGARRDGREPVDATCEMQLGLLRRYLDEPESNHPPPISRVVQYDLGSVDGVRLTFTDATVINERILFLAVAEDSPDAVQDGPVAGVAIGVMEPDHSARWTLLRDGSGKPFLGKAEGIVVPPGNPRCAYVVVDPDDPDVPADLCVLELNL